MLRDYGIKHMNAGAVRTAMSLMLIILIAVSVYSLISGENGIVATISANKAAQSNARTALTYLTSVLRRNDVNGALSIKTVSDAGRLALGVDGTWIYCEDGFLTEFGADGSGAVKIAEVKDFLITYDPKYNLITGSVLYEYDGSDKIDRVSVYIRSAVTLID